MHKVIEKYFQHYNSREVRNALNAWVEHFKNGGKMYISLGGAMSTAGIGAILSKLIDTDLVNGISCTGANLEEDYFRAVGYSKYLQFNQPWNLTIEDEVEIVE